jgi:hypothetical protein
MNSALPRSIRVGSAAWSLASADPASVPALSRASAPILAVILASVFVPLRDFCFRLKQRLVWPVMVSGGVFLSHLTYKPPGAQQLPSCGIRSNVELQSHCGGLQKRILESAVHLFGAPAKLYRPGPVPVPIGLASTLTRRAPWKGCVRMAGSGRAFLLPSHPPPG